MYLGIIVLFCFFRKLSKDRGSHANWSVNKLVGTTFFLYLSKVFLSTVNDDNYFGKIFTSQTERRLSCLPVIFMTASEGTLNPKVGTLQALKLHARPQPRLY